MDVMYGAKGVPSSTNTPGYRRYALANWVDNSNNLWLFGGEGIHHNSMGYKNDLWKYDISNNTWTWVNGDSVPVNMGNYGTIGVANAGNSPPSRSSSIGWKDKNGDLWLFGGYLYSSSPAFNGSYNDLWRYTIATNTWTWMDGSQNPINAAGNWGVKCTGTSARVPSSRFSHVAHWVDDCGNFWMFGGYNNAIGMYGDLWKYNPTTNIWTWTSGNNTTGGVGAYGTKGVIMATNKPGPRFGGIGWKSKDGIYLFGGTSAVNEQRTWNDLWKYYPSKPVADFNFMKTSGGCETVNFTNNSQLNCDEIKSYTWSFGDPASGITNSSTELNPSHVFYQPGTRQVKLVTRSCSNIDSITKSITINSSGSIDAGTNITISYGNSTTLAPSGGTVYTWYPPEGLSCINCNNPIASPTQRTIYYVSGADANGCIGIDSVIVDVELTCGDPFLPTAFSPNEDGQNDILCIQGSCVQTLKLIIFNRWGQEVFTANNLSAACWDGKQKGEKLNTGVFGYYYEITLLNGNLFKKSGNISLIR